MFGIFCSFFHLVVLLRALTLLFVDAWKCHTRRLLGRCTQNQVP